MRLTPRVGDTPVTIPTRRPDAPNAEQARNGKLAFARLGNPAAPPSSSAVGRSTPALPGPDDHPIIAPETPELGDGLTVSSLFAATRGSTLEKWLATPASWMSRVREVFGKDASPPRAEQIRRRLLEAVNTGDWSFLKVRVVADDHPYVRAGGFAAYAGGDDRVADGIYIARSTLRDPQRLESSFFEELGHWVDDQLRPGGGDAIGDEGERFAALLDGSQPPAESSNEDDRHLVIGSNGKTFSVERAANTIFVTSPQASLAAIRFYLRENWVKVTGQDQVLSLKELQALNVSWIPDPAQRKLVQGGLTEWKNNWKNVTGSSTGTLTRKELLDKIADSAPSKAERLKALEGVEAAFDGLKGGITSAAEIMDNCVMNSALYKELGLTGLQGIQEQLVYWFYNWSDDTRKLLSNRNAIQDAIGALRKELGFIKLRATLEDGITAVYELPDGSKSNEIPVAKNGTKILVQFWHHGQKVGVPQQIVVGQSFPEQKSLQEKADNGGTIKFNFQGGLLTASNVQPIYNKPVEGDIVWALAVLKTEIPHAGLSRSALDRATTDIQRGIPDGRPLLRSVLGYFYQNERNWKSLVGSSTGKLTREILGRKIGEILAEDKVDSGSRTGFYRFDLNGRDSGSDELHTITQETRVAYSYKDPITGLNLYLPIDNPRFRNEGGSEAGRIILSLPKGTDGILTLIQRDGPVNDNYLSMLESDRLMNWAEVLTMTPPMKYSLESVGENNFTVNGKPWPKNNFIAPAITDDQESYLNNWKGAQIRLHTAAKFVLEALRIPDSATASLADKITNAENRLEQIREELASFNAEIENVAKAEADMNAVGVLDIWRVGYAQKFSADLAEVYKKLPVKLADVADWYKEQIERTASQAALDRTFAIVGMVFAALDGITSLGSLAVSWASYAKKSHVYKGQRVWLDLDVTSTRSKYVSEAAKVPDTPGVNSAFRVALNKPLTDFEIETDKDSFPDLGQREAAWEARKQSLIRSLASREGPNLGERQTAFDAYKKHSIAVSKRRANQKKLEVLTLDKKAIALDSISIPGAVAALAQTLTDSGIAVGKQFGIRGTELSDLEYQFNQAKNALNNLVATMILHRSEETVWTPGLGFDLNSVQDGAPLTPEEINKYIPNEPYVDAKWYRRVANGIETQEVFVEIRAKVFNMASTTY